MFYQIHPKFEVLAPAFGMGNLFISFRADLDLFYASAAIDSCYIRTCLQRGERYHITEFIFNYNNFAERFYINNFVRYHRSWSYALAIVTDLHKLGMKSLEIIRKNWQHHHNVFSTFRCSILRTYNGSPGYTLPCYSI